jgi:subtilisin family serine protease
MKSSLLLSTLMLAAAVAAHAETSKLDPRARVALAGLRAGASVAALLESGAAVNAAREIDVFIVGSASRAELEAAGAHVRTSLPGVATAYVPAAAIDRVAALARVERIEGAMMVEPVLNASVPSTAASYQRGPGPDFTGLNGAGVLVGVVDTGVDWDHPDFKNPDGTTRLVSIWDQTDNGGPRPAGYSYGVEWMASNITAGLPREVDTDGHGTHCLGIAAGDGSATGGSVPAFTYVGMAPKADLCMVKTNFTSTGILDGVAYIFGRATALGKNAVVSLSLGTLGGPKDGTDGFEAGLNALTGPGRIVACSAGNDRGRPVHAETIAPVSGTGTIVQSFPNTTAPGLVKIDGYYESGLNLSLTLTTPRGTVIGPIALGSRNTSSPPGQLTPDGLVYVENGFSLTATGDRYVHVEISVPNPNSTAANPGGGWTYRFTNTGGSPAEVDLWTYYRSMAANFVDGQGNQPYEEMIIEPANAPDVITVGAWMSKNAWIDCADRAQGYPTLQVGMLAGFSAPGPTRDGRQKPDLVAPGISIGSTTTFDVTAQCPANYYLLNDGMQHVINEGTSMSSPHVSGAAALLMQKYGALTPAQVKQMLFDRAIVDGFTGATWNKDWGHGKLSVGDLTDPVAQVQYPNGGEVLTIGSVATLSWNATDAYGGVTAVDLALRRSELGAWETLATGVANTGAWNWTVSGPMSAEARVRVVAHDSTANAGRDSSDAVFAITGAASSPSAGAILDFSLALRSTNPARGAVDVEFEVPRSSPVSVSVYDLAGRKVATLASGPHAVGSYHARWSGVAGGSASGVYFVRLTAPGRDLSRRIAIAK